MLPAITGRGDLTGPLTSATAIRASLDRDERRQEQRHEIGTLALES